MGRQTEVDISVIVPIYNAERYLQRCINSIKGQTYENYEVILVNDGSVDTSESICRNYQKDDSRVRYILQDNQGVAAARNNGIRAARGKYVALLDNDDYLNKDFLKEIMRHDYTNADVMLFQFVNVASDEEINANLCKSVPEAQVEIFEGKGDYLQQEMFCPTSEEIKKSTIVFPWGKAYRREFLLEHDILFDSRVKLCEDVYLNLYAYEYAKRVIYIYYPAYFYFHNRQSAGKGFNPAVADMEAENIAILDRFVYGERRSREYLKSYDNCLCFRYWSCCFAYFVHPQNTKKIREIIGEMKAFEQRTNVRRAFKTLPYIAKSMELKEWIFLMAIKFHLYRLILLAARIKMRISGR